MLPNRLAAIEYQAAAAVSGFKIMPIARSHQKSIPHLQGNAFALNLQFKATMKRPDYLEMIVHVPARSLSVSTHRQLGIWSHQV